MHPRFEELRARLKGRPLVLGVLNVTPDSFSDGGLWTAPDAALDHALDMVRAGADGIDLGGESTRPGARGVGLEQEWARVLPVLEALRAAAPGLALSIDTQKAEVARRALAAGACMVNDVSALRADADMAKVLADTGAGVCLMHRCEAPADAVWSPQESGRYGPQGVAAAVLSFFEERLEACARAGIAREAVWLDPGLGFGKSVAENLRLIKDLPVLARLGLPLMVGPSRKSFLGAALGGLPVAERLSATLAACAVAAWQGASVLRVHDARETAQVLGLVRAIRES